MARTALASPGFGSSAPGSGGKAIKRKLGFVQRLFILLFLSNRNNLLKYDRRLSRVLNIHDWLSVLLGTLSCAFYIIRTYTSDSGGGLFVSEVFFSVFFCLEFFVRVFVIAEERIRYVISPIGIADFFAGVLPMVGLILQFSGVREGYYVSVFLVFRAVRIVTSVQVGILEFWASNSEPGSVFFDNAKQDHELLRFHDFVYFVVVTIATLGYGDVAPVADARLLVVVLIVVGLLVIPAQTSRVLAAMREESRYGGSYALSRTPFIVLGGSASADVILSFLNEFFTAAHGVDRRVVVILRPADPEPKLKALVQSARYASLLVYLRGSILSRQDRGRAKVSHAESVVLLADDWAPSAADEDGGNIMRALALREESAELPVMLCLLRRESLTPLVREVASLALSTRHLHASLLARSLSCRGLSTLILNILCVHGRMPPHAPAFSPRRAFPPAVRALFEDASRKGGDWDGPWEEAPPYNESWIAEYDYGYAQSIYCVPLGSAFEGYTVIEAAAKAHVEFGVLLLAVQASIHMDPGSPGAGRSSMDFRRRASSDRGRSSFENTLYDRVPRSGSGANLAARRSCSFGPNQESIRAGIAAARAGVEIPIHVGPSRQVVSAGDAAYVIATSEAAAQRLSDATAEESLHGTKNAFVSSGVARLRALNRRRSLREEDPRQAAASPTGEIFAGGTVGSAVAASDAQANGHANGRSEGGTELAGVRLQVAVGPEAAAAALGDWEPYHPFGLEKEEQDEAEKERTTEERTLLRPNGELPSFIRDHFLVTGRLRGLRRLLRSMRREKGRVVAVLAKGPPSASVLRLMRADRALWYVEGSGTRGDDLLRAGGARAAAVLVRSTATDANAVAAVESVSDTEPAPPLRRRLGAARRSAAQRSAADFLPASRESASPASVMGGSLVAEAVAGNARMRPAFATGAALCRNFLESILCQAYFLGYNVVRIVERLLDAGEHRPSGPPSIALYRVPARLMGAPYEDLFLELLASGLLPLGLYRSAMRRGPAVGSGGAGGGFSGAGVRDEARFVFCNPAGRTALRAGDLVYALRGPD
eukprot:tig00021521_g22082.t1